MRRYAPLFDERGRLSRFLVVALSLLGLVVAPAAAGAAPAAAGASPVIRSGQPAAPGGAASGGTVRGRSPAARSAAARHVRQCAPRGCPHARDAAAAARDLGAPHSGAPLAAVLPGAPAPGPLPQTGVRPAGQAQYATSARISAARGRAPPSSTTTRLI
ncbi:hypothetical protein Acsp04_12530 [Actinomadura sp. NBRC 104425]|uniref:hypothetical protein n=1 Tax=Actinomadura sp. NBRC 104425 TaxID=3032204 RepID=UPI0024A17BB3|nr:hypothetical protein [Actinomadura sp. NBRC 104425]GLZ11018.1 hypothetical protein Acsp04_12530 [Actinomadura sp. NBRC 104425]